MGLTAMGVFAGALLVAAASSRPGIAALVARVIGRGTHAQRLLNRTGGTLMGCAAVAVATK